MLMINSFLLECARAVTDRPVAPSICSSVTAPASTQLPSTCALQAQLTLLLGLKTFTPHLIVAAAAADAQTKDATAVCVAV